MEKHTVNGIQLYKNFRLPNYTNLVYNSLKDKELWEKRLQKISQEWDKTEKIAVLKGIKEVAQQPIGKDSYHHTLLPWLETNKLEHRIVRKVSYFSGFAQYYSDGDDFYIVAFSREKEKLENPDLFLGYPECCVKAFKNNFPQILDPMWSWANSGEVKNRLDSENSSGIIHNEISLNKVEVYANPLLRYFNVRFTSHIPCSFLCQDSIRVGKAFAECMESDVREWREELLSQEIVWDNYHGVADVWTKPFRGRVASNPTVEKYILRVNQEIPVNLVQLRRAA